MKKSINKEYENGKKLLEDYIEKQNKYCEFLQKLLDKWKYSPTENIPEMEGMNPYVMREFIRTWKLIQELPTDKKNLLLTFCLCEYDYEKTLAVFNGVGKNYKNVSSLRVLISNIRKMLRTNYTEKYGERKLEI